MVRGRPRMCMATQPAPVAAATSQSDAEMSLTRLAPALTAAAATSGLTVSTETRAPWAAAGPARASTTGTTRASSTSVSTSSAPGRDDSPPTSIDVGALGQHLETARHRRPEGVVEPAVGEGVRRDVEDAHHERPPGTGARPHRISDPG